MGGEQSPTRSPSPHGHGKPRMKRGVSSYLHMSKQDMMEESKEVTVPYRCRRYGCGKIFFAGPTANGSSRGQETDKEEDICYHHPGYWNPGSSNGLWGAHWSCCSGSWVQEGCTEGRHNGKCVLLGDKCNNCRRHFLPDREREAFHTFMEGKRSLVESPENEKDRRRQRRASRRRSTRQSITPATIFKQTLEFGLSLDSESGPCDERMEMTEYSRMTMTIGSDDESEKQDTTAVSAVDNDEDGQSVSLATKERDALAHEGGAIWPEEKVKLKWNPTGELQGEELFVANSNKKREQELMGKDPQELLQELVAVVEPLRLGGGAVSFPKNRILQGKTGSSIVYSTKKLVPEDVELLAVSTMFSPTELRTLKKRTFHGGIGNKQVLMPYKQFVSVMEEMEVFKGVERKLFRMCDVDRSDEIEFKEFVFFLERLFGGTGLARMKTILLLFDTVSEGYTRASFMEINKTLKSWHAGQTFPKEIRKASVCSENTDPQFVLMVQTMFDEHKKNIEKAVKEGFGKERREEIEAILKTQSFGPRGRKADLTRAQKQRLALLRKQSVLENPDRMSVDALVKHIEGNTEAYLVYHRNFVEMHSVKLRYKLMGTGLSSGLNQPYERRRTKQQQALRADRLAKGRGCIEQVYVPALHTPPPKTRPMSAPPKTTISPLSTPSTAGARPTTATPYGPSEHQSEPRKIPSKLPRTRSVNYLSVGEETASANTKKQSRRPKSAQAKARPFSPTFGTGIVEPTDPFHKPGYISPLKPAASTLQGRRKQKTEQRPKSAQTILVKPYHYEDEKHGAPEVVVVEDETGAQTFVPKQLMESDDDASNSGEGNHRHANSPKVPISPLSSGGEDSYDNDADWESSGEGNGGVSHEEEGESEKKTQQNVGGGVTASGDNGILDSGSTTATSPDEDRIARALKNKDVEYLMEHVFVDELKDVPFKPVHINSSIESNEELWLGAYAARNDKFKQSPTAKDSPIHRNFELGASGTLSAQRQTTASLYDLPAEATQSSRTSLSGDYTSDSADAPYPYPYPYYLGITSLTPNKNAGRRTRPMSAISRSSSRSPDNFKSMSKRSPATKKKATKPKVPTFTNYSERELVALQKLKETEKAASPAPHPLRPLRRGYPSKSALKRPTSAAAYRGKETRSVFMRGESPPCLDPSFVFPRSRFEDALSEVNTGKI